jgi:hypothetical protein
MHTPAEFNQFANPEKWAIIEDYGIYLDVYRMEGELKICLFSLFNYYVEVFYQPKQDKLKKAAALISWDGLDPYLKQINIAGLCACL